MRALRYYLDWTKDLRGSRSLLFFSFKTGHTSDIRPATLSSWLKQTILLCYKQADQLKAHDILAFVASKAFYGGVSLDQIMQACHWKAHNTFTNFYLNDLTWFRQRQQYVSGTHGGSTTSPRSFPSDQLSSERKKGRGHIHYNQVFRSLIPGSRYSFTFKMLRVRSFCFLVYQSNLY